jgi:hypothetical protein
MGRIAARSILALPALLAAGACSLGEGKGAVSSDKLDAEGCYDGAFELNPDFFAAVPYRNTLDIRVQHGGDLEEVSDGMTVLVDDIARVEQSLGQPLQVGQPPGVTPPGIPIVKNPNPPIVHATVYLHRSCHAQNVALYSIAGTITFHSIFDGDPNETDANRNLTSADFADITVADPRDMSPDGTALHASHIHGFFNFYFQRGQPAQPFP